MPFDLTTLESSSSTLFAICPDGFIRQIQLTATPIVSSENVFKTFLESQSFVVPIEEGLDLVASGKNPDNRLFICEIDVLHLKTYIRFETLDGKLLAYPWYVPGASGTPGVKSDFTWVPPAETSIKLVYHPRIKESCWILLRLNRKDATRRWRTLPLPNQFKGPGYLCFGDLQQSLPDIKEVGIAAHAHATVEAFSQSEWNRDLLGSLDQNRSRALFGRRINNSLNPSLEDSTLLDVDEAVIRNTTDEFTGPCLWALEAYDKEIQRTEVTNGANA